MAPSFFKGVQFDQGKEGPTILLAHSQGAGPGRLTAIKNKRVQAIVAFAPESSCLFPLAEPVNG